jgi:SAM-dependent methyltransferase
MFKFYHKQLFAPNFLSIFINSFYFSRKGLHRKLKKICPNLNGSVLDFGCGRKPYRDLFNNVSEYIGVDYENEGHPHENEDIDVFYDGKSLPFESERFDVVFSSEVFEHVENLDEMIKELHRVLKPGGKLLVTVPFVYMEHEMPYDFRRFSINGLSSFLKNNGFKVLAQHKSTKDIETLFQVIAFNIYSFYLNQNKYIKLLLNFIFIAPFNILGIILSFILPNRGRFYSNCIIVSEKAA